MQAAIADSSGPAAVLLPVAEASQPQVVDGTSALDATWRDPWHPLAHALSHLLRCAQSVIGQAGDASSSQMPTHKPNTVGAQEHPGQHRQAPARSDTSLEILTD